MADDTTVNVQEQDPAETHEGDSPSLDSVLAELDDLEGSSQPAGSTESGAETEQGSAPAESQEASETPAEEPQQAAEESEATDAETEKRLERIKSEEKRARDELTREREQIEARAKQLEKEWGPEIERAKKLGDFESRAKYDLPGLLEDIGIPRSEHEQYARQMYRYAKGGPDAASDMRSRKAETEVQQLRRELREMKDQQAQQTQTAQQEQAIGQYLDSVQAAAKPDKAPLVARMAEKDAAGTRKRIHATADELARETGRAPDAADVLAKLEKGWRAELTSLGADVDSVIGSKSAPEPAKSEPEASKQKTPESAGEQKSGETTPSSESEEDTEEPPQSQDPWEERRELIRMIEEGRA